MKPLTKTNVMRVLEQKKVPYTAHAYAPEDMDPSEVAALSGEEIARRLGEPVERVFKTLVTRGKTGQYYVFVVPVAEELDLKKAAKACGEKAVAMIPQKELLPLTGYVHGGCSPVGMKKQFPTFVHETAAGFETFYVSAGKVGVQIELDANDLGKVIRLQFADVVC
ncbi:MAG: Cys-tRNA(Pro) deacylase [Clostridia bacterium]|nr:Cys-tRNA(Pro) deacylase [Clostridia bacterium]